MGDLDVLDITGAVIQAMGPARCGRCLTPLVGPTFGDLGVPKHYMCSGVPAHQAWLLGSIDQYSLQKVLV